MIVTDLREIPNQVTLEADICIIGSGPAGLTIAREFAQREFTVMILARIIHEAGEAAFS
jgi:ribulose 1,5-bisphosphate synthetase/thiazole synthase